MILKQVIKYTNAPAIEATWVDEGGVVLKCQAYSNGQMDMLRNDLESPRVSWRLFGLSQATIMAV